MNSLFGGSQQSPEQIEALRKARQEYLDYLTNQQTNTNASVNKNELTPESGNAILKVVKDAQDWMAKNPNADLNTVTTKREATDIEIKRILVTDQPKKVVFVVYTILPVVAKDAEQKNLIKPEITPKIVALADELKQWYKKNKDTATLIDIAQKLHTVFNEKLKEIVVDMTAFEFITTKVTELLNKSPDEIEKLRQAEEKTIQNRQDQSVDVGKGFSIAKDTAISTFFKFLLVAFCILAGSFAANLAIGRSPAYRVLYFIWGAIPFFSPLVILYTIYKRIKEGRLSIYAILPISIEPATTRIGRFLWYPFYYLPDDTAVAMYNAFQESLKAVASP